jgi:hypothetical protein
VTRKSLWIIKEQDISTSLGSSGERKGKKEVEAVLKKGRGRKENLQLIGNHAEILK